MTKPELVAFVMASTAVYKKTHLMEKHKDELESIAAAFSRLDEIADAATEMPTSETQYAYAGTEGITVDDTPRAPTLEVPASDAPSNALDTITATVLAVYDDNEKIVKGRRIDKDEFKATVIEKVSAQISTGQATDQALIGELTVTTMKLFLSDLIAFCPMNDNERKMLETIPLLPDYMDIESQVNGKGFLQKVKELHNIDVNTSRALMVSLKKKKFITIGGGKKTFIVLLERGVRHLRKA